MPPRPQCGSRHMSGRVGPVTRSSLARPPPGGLQDQIALCFDTPAAEIALCFDTPVGTRSPAPQRWTDLAIRLNSEPPSVTRSSFPWPIPNARGPRPLRATLRTGCSPCRSTSPANCGGWQEDNEGTFSNPDPAPQTGALGCVPYSLARSRTPGAAVALSGDCSACRHQKSCLIRPKFAKSR